MDKCPHVRQDFSRISACQKGSLLNPRNWSCSDCGTTESVWACLSCSHFACGRAAHGHAIKHFDMTGHPLTIEVNNKYIHCYICDDWVLNDILTEDIKLLQSLLHQVADQNYIESTTRSGHVIRPSASVFRRMESRHEEAQSRTADKQYTASYHYKYLILSRTFGAWRKYLQLSKLEETQNTETRKRKRLITPGMTGLRNLGNTCYMNAALQALGHLEFLRETFRQMGSSNEHNKPQGSSVLFNRQTTVECFQHISSKPALINNTSRLKRQTGSNEDKKRRQSVTMPQDEDCLTSLTQEIHGLMRVMWSGKWAVVTPHTILSAIWHYIPNFRGYCQQDAQEFLCELLDQLQTELLKCPSELVIKISSPFKDVVPARELLQSLFEGQLMSTITYDNCKHCSVVYESFWDLSLEIPTAQQCTATGRRSLSSSSSLTDSLNEFTRFENINDKAFECSNCLEQRQSITKRILISKAPEVLRLHLKRFRYFKNSWQKITNQIIFPMELNIYPYCHHDDQSVGVLNGEEDMIYDLSSVIVHHGQCFNTGHYTAYCWNNDANCWIHCNDARLTRSSPDEVLKSQAYVLFYARRTGRSPVIPCDDTTPYKYHKYS